MRSKSDGEAGHELWGPGVNVNIHASRHRKVGCQGAPIGANLMPRNRPTFGGELR